jgi:hypothetical protein
MDFFPQKIVIFALSIHVALEAFSSNFHILRITMVMYTVFEVVVHLSEVSNDLATLYIYKLCQILYF